jgi:chemotaxis protein CheC
MDMPEGVRRRERLPHLRRFVVPAVDAAANTLTQMTGIEISVASCSVNLVRLAELPASAGNPEEIAIGIYLGMHGDGQGHILLLMDGSVAQQVAGLMLGEAPEDVSIEDELAASALAEAGNVSCGAFMNALGDATAVRLELTPPAVVEDMRGAIVDAVVAEIALLGDEALVIGTRFALPDDDAQALDVRFLVVPSPETLDLLLERSIVVTA